MNIKERCGISVAGSVLVDIINEISAYPQIGELSKITNITTAVGGCVPNVALDLKKIWPALPVTAIGRVGADKEGEFLTSTLHEAGIDVGQIAFVAGEKTTFTDVMSVTGGQRTFFTYSGADGKFCADDVNFDSLDSRILHLGYFLLLDYVDNGEGLEILKRASAHKIKTSIDMVSENSDRYSLVLPCLPYTDYLIINETEASKLTGITPKLENLEAITKKLKAAGVREKVIIHMPECSVCYSDEGFSMVSSLDVPQSYIKGTTGAGDAFCAGALIGIYKGMPDVQIMEFASCVAAMALGSPDATSGIRTEEEIIKYCNRFARKKVCL